MTSPRKKRKSPEPCVPARPAVCRLLFPDAESAKAALEEIKAGEAGLCGLSVADLDGKTTLSGILPGGMRAGSIGCLLVSLDRVAQAHRGQFLSIASAAGHTPETTAP